MNTPELDKLHKAADSSQCCGEFLEWLLQKYELCTRNGGRLVPISAGIDKLLAEFFDIDLGKIEQEKMEVLSNLRKLSRAE